MRSGAWPQAWRSPFSGILPRDGYVIHAEAALSERTYSLSSSQRISFSSIAAMICLMRSDAAASSS